MNSVQLLKQVCYVGTKNKWSDFSISFLSSTDECQTTTLAIFEM